jgi:hypothetical protein
MTVIDTSKTRMQKKRKEYLNNNVNQGFDWMLDSKSDNKQTEEQIFSYNFLKSVSFFSKKFQISLNLKGFRNVSRN